jgi:CHAD domain-containing protein
MMVQKSKWIEGLSPDDRFTKAARHTLDVRLKLVWRYLKPAAAADGSSMESIHQLRVSTRRAKAALHSYRSVLPEERGNWMDKQLKRIRKAAGDARDYDVLIARLAPRAAEGGADWSALLDLLRDFREKAQRPIKKIYRRLKGHRFKRRVNELVERIKWESADEGAEEPSFALAAHLGMRETIEPFFAAADGPPTDIAALHEFRILGKQVRYAMEAFHEGFPPSFRTEVYPQIELFQEKLGAVIDHASAEQRFGQWLDIHGEDGLAGPLKHLLDEERTAVEESRRQFFDWWTPERRSLMRQRFDELLDTPVVEHVA